MSHKPNRLVMMGGLLAMATAIFAIFAGTSSALNWTTETVMTSGTMEIGLQASGNSVFTGKVSGQPLELTAKKVEAVTGTVIQQSGSGIGGAALGTGAVKYLELSLQKPPECFPPKIVQTEGLKAELAPVAALTSGLGVKLRPSSTTQPLLLAKFELTGECALAGIPIKLMIPSGSYFCAEVEPLGSMLAQEPIRSSATINEKCGGKLEAAGNPAVLTGTVTAFSKQTPGASWGVQ